MGDAIAMLLSGGATGLLGTVLSGGLSYFNKRQAGKHALQMREMDLKELQLEAQMAEKVAAFNLESAALQGSYKDASTFITSNMQLTKGQQWVALFIDLIRGLMRPAITLFFLWMAYRLFLEGTLASDIEHAIIYMTTTSVLWWMGSRQVEKTLGAK